MQLNVRVGVIEGVLANVFHCDRDSLKDVGDYVVLALVLMLLPCD